MCGEYMITQRDVCDGIVFEDEIAFVRKRMQRFYTRGWTRLGESESKRLAELEKELEKIK